MFNVDRRGLNRLLSSVTATPFKIKGSALLKRDQERVLELAEERLTRNPTKCTAHRFIAPAADALDFQETAVFAFEHIRTHKPENVDNLLDLGNALLAAGRPEEAIRIGDEVLKQDPANGSAQQLIKSASVERSLIKGGREPVSRPKGRESARKRRCAGIHLPMHMRGRGRPGAVGTEDFTLIPKKTAAPGYIGTR